MENEQTSAIFYKNIALLKELIGEGDNELRKALTGSMASALKNEQKSAILFANLTLMRETIGDGYKGLRKALTGSIVAALSSELRSAAYPNCDSSTRSAAWQRVRCQHSRAFVRTALIAVE